jgi:hypothetical protein
LKYVHVVAFHYREKWIREENAEWFDPARKPDHWYLKKQLARIGVETEAVIEKGEGTA